MIFVKDLIGDKRKVYLLRSFFNLHWVYEKDKRWVWVLFILPWIYFPNFKSDCILGICIKKAGYTRCETNVFILPEYMMQYTRMKRYLCRGLCTVQYYYKCPLANVRIKTNALEKRALKIMVYSLTCYNPIYYFS